MATRLVRSWDVDDFHRQVAELERQGWQARRESYRVTPEMNPETGQVSHLHTIELVRED
jgi:hypothetical protein